VDSINQRDLNFSGIANYNPASPEDQDWFVAQAQAAAMSGRSPTQQQAPAPAG